MLNEQSVTTAQFLYHVPDESGKSDFFFPDLSLQGTHKCPVNQC